MSMCIIYKSVGDFLNIILFVVSLVNLTTNYFFYIIFIFYYSYKAIEKKYLILLIPCSS